ncbi:MAG: hypothetical protein ACM3Q1_17545, partial [Bacteroidales bacterium]
GEAAQNDAVRVDHNPLLLNFGRFDVIGLHGTHGKTSWGVRTNPASEGAEYAIASVRVNDN